ncbi:30S ribosomal protein S2 [Candidatus Saccharibacteria bacterium]|jgi:small subunit ribosomal protein S2|nr:30S ribosomal protein S2 [Candidatus Saccharibacteria bacterium]MCA9312995.1 30S ribosomal protein S2 [Candidatus Saccharibacteria bacterium]MDQ5970136.1 small subunit ribosomal protein [Patescibacteria group bacterium]
MAVAVDIKKLLESGAHFGHTTSRWHPKMAKFIHSKRAGNHIIDLTKTVEAIESVLPLIEKTVASGKQVVLVGTKRQAKELVKNAAEETGMPYVVNRWVGGMLTNTTTMNARIKHLQDLENKMASGELANKYNKLEVQRFQEEIDQMNILYGGIKDLQGRPGLVYVTDIVTDHLAVSEAKRLGVPVVAVVDSNANPDLVDYPIPANDDALKAIETILDYVVGAINNGKASQKSAKSEE